MLEAVLLARQAEGWLHVRQKLQPQCVVVDFTQAEVNELDAQLHSERRGRDALVQARDDAHAAREEAEQRAAQLELRTAEAQAEAEAAHQQLCVLTVTAAQEADALRMHLRAVSA